jgi:hypothetical protein
MHEPCKDDYVEDSQKLPQFNQGNNQGFICGSIKETIKGLTQRMSPILMT